MLLFWTLLLKQEYQKLNELQHSSKNRLVNSQSFFKVASDQKLAPEDEEATSGLRVDIEDSQRNLWSNQNH